MHPGLRPARARLRYALSPMGLVDLMAFLPGLLVPVVPLSASVFNAARIIRLTGMYWVMTTITTTGYGDLVSEFRAQDARKLGADAREAAEGSDPPPDDADTLQDQAP